MGSSFTQFRGCGFWARDPRLELWLFLLAEQAAMLERPPEWLQQAGEHWRGQATVGMIGCISADLDDYLNSPERLELVVLLSKQTLARLRSFGPLLSKAKLNSFGLGGPGSFFTADLEVETLIPLSEAFIQLLRGELATDAETSPML